MSQSKNYSSYGSQSSISSAAAAAAAAAAAVSAAIANGTAYKPPNKRDYEGKYLKSK